MSAFATLKSPYIRKLILRSPVLKDHGTLSEKYLGISKEEWETNGFKGNTETKGRPLSFRFYLDSQKYNVLEKVKEIKIPLLLVQEEKDEIIPKDTAEHFSQENDLVTLKFIKNALHKFTIEQNQEFIEIIDEFLKI